MHDNRQYQVLSNRQNHPAHSFIERPETVPTPAAATNLGPAAFFPEQVGG